MKHTYCKKINKKITRFKTVCDLKKEQEICKNGCDNDSNRHTPPRRSSWRLSELRPENRERTMEERDNGDGSHTVDGRLESDVTS